MYIVEPRTGLNGSDYVLLEATQTVPVYLLTRKWNVPQAVGSYFIAILGAYTASQLICQCSATHRLHVKLGWLALASFSLGGTAIWGMHWVKMLAMSIGIPVQFNTPVALFAGVVAVVGTFITLSFDILLEEYNKRRRGQPIRFSLYTPLPRTNPSDESLPLQPSIPVEIQDEDMPSDQAHATLRRRLSAVKADGRLKTAIIPDVSPSLADGTVIATSPSDAGASPQPIPESRPISEHNRPATPSSNSSLSGLELAYRSQLETEAALSPEDYEERLASRVLGKSRIGRMFWTFWDSAKMRTLMKGTLLGSVILCMHYSAMWTMRMDGFFKWNMTLVFWSAVFALGTTNIVVMYLPSEPNAIRQAWVSVLGPTGISSMHFLGIAAGSIYTTIPPPHNNDQVSSNLPLLILVMAILTYVISYALLAHLLTQSRNRLVETYTTKRQLWKAIAENQAFARANKVKSEFISVASHEIRTPLHAISGYTDLLLQTQLTEEQTTFLEAVQVGCRAIQLITNNVLDFSKLEHDSKESIARPANVDIRALVEHVLRSCATPRRMTEVQFRRLELRDETLPDSSSWHDYLPGTSHVELLSLIDENVPSTVYLDEVYLTRLLMNLITNALKFTDEGYVMVHVSVIHPKNSLGWPLLSISVRDTGIGIPKEARATIFEPFRQADSSLTRQHTGAGLGLAISKQLCERMGGTITLSSEEHIGSEFTVQFPAFSSVEDALVPFEVEDHSEHVAVAVSVISPKTFHLLQKTLGKKNFSVHAVDLSHAGREQQPALMKSHRLWMDIECFMLAPWLLDYLAQAPPSSRPSVHILYDDVGSGAGLRFLSVLKDHGRLELIRRPIIVHDVLRSLRHGVEVDIPDGPAPSLPTPSTTPTSISPLGHPKPQLRDPSPSDLTPLSGGPSGVLRQDPMQRALDLGESVMDGRLPPSDGRRVRFENGNEDSGTESRNVHEYFPAPSVAAPERKPIVEKVEQTPEAPVILLVEDNLVNQKLGIRMLQKLAYRCDVAENGQIALDLVIAHGPKYSLVLMDCQMPVMNGFECTRRIRALERDGRKGGRLPIVALTANVSSESRAQCEQAGADLFLPKPLHLNDLDAAIKQYITQPTAQ